MIFFALTNFLVKNQTKLAFYSYLEPLLITKEVFSKGNITKDYITKGNYPSITKTGLHNKDGLTLHNKDGRK
jgi:hypothetical protein